MDFYVYLHKKKTNGEVFYVGKGSGDRAWKKEGRNEFWKKVVNKHGYDVEIHSNHLQEWYAFELERDLIAYYGRRQLGLGTLVNLSDGGEGTGGWVPSQEFIDFRRKIMQREDAPNKDKTVWTFKNLKTGEEVSATRYQFRQIHPEVLVNTICTSDGSSYDWVVIENQTEFSMQAKINNYKGIYNPVSDKTKYSITNVNTLEVFVGLRSELSDKIGCDAAPLVRKEHNVSMGWALTERFASGDIRLDQRGINASNLDNEVYSFTNIETCEIFTGKRVEFETKYGFTLKPLFSGNKTCRNWALSAVVEEVGLDLLRNPRTGDLNVNADTAKYAFKNLITEEEFIGTRAEFKKKFGININQLFSERNYLSANYWCLKDNFDAAKAISPSDLNIYTFVHSTGMKFTGTRKQMKEEIGICVKPLFVGKSFLQTKGWALERNADIAFRRGQDKTEYKFVHESGDVFVGTRREFEIAYSITCRILFCKKAKKKHKGWSLSPQQPE